MKRKCLQYVSNSCHATRSKRLKLLSPYQSPKRNYFWVNGTDVKNYILKDPLVDWLKFMKNGNRQKFKNYSQDDFILQRGHDFEKEVVNHINKFISVVTVSNIITTESCRKTIELMKSGVPVIHSAPFKNGKKHIRGVIDFLVRSDYLHIFTGENVLPKKSRDIKAPNLNGSFHYVVLDVKFSTLHLRSDGMHLLNTDNYPAYKSQLWIYTQGIGHIQGYTSRYAYIIGRRYKYTVAGEVFTSLNCFDKLGRIDYEGVDKDYVQYTQDAINWLKRVKKQGKSWTIDPPSCTELYPNMCINSGIWNQEKKKIADNIGEITQIWSCGVKNRNIAISKGITSWRDNRCNSTTIGINGSRAEIVDSIININRQDVNKILPQKINNNLFEWKNITTEIFVDFETFSDIFASLDNLPLQERTNMIFMIGVYYKNCDTWEYKNFLANNATKEEENRIMEEFNTFVIVQGRPKLWYWHADKSIWKRKKSFECEEHEWADLSEIFRFEPIVIKDCFNFGLKEVSKAMKKHNLIQTEIDSICSNGLEASVIAWKAYHESENVVEDSRIMDIAKYNEFDVKVLWEILSYLRLKHT